MANLQSENSNHGLRYMLSQYWQDNGNPRTAGLPLIREGPWFTFCVIGVYLIFVTKVGPAMMRKRAPYQLRLPMLVYNSSMVVINFYFLFKSLSWLNYGRELVNFKWPEWESSAKFNTEEAREQVWSFYLYWLTKFVDLLDTIFFVLRKKDRQISHLHLYHHSIVPILGWYYIWYVFGVPAINLFAFLNSCCHTIMYSYYALSALGPQIQPYLWWKKYITQIQLLQFLLLGLYGVVVYIWAIDYPPFAFWLATSQPPIFFGLFANFYIQSYRQQQQKIHQHQQQHQQQQSEKKIE